MSHLFPKFHLFHVLKEKITEFSYWMAMWFGLFHGPVSLEVYSFLFSETASQSSGS